MNEHDHEVESPLRQRPPERSGEFLLRVLKPFGCVLVLIIFVLYLVFCFTYRGTPAPAAEPTAQTQTQS